ncbi:MAG TPA: hypothetical protein VKR56_09335 [Candidatus Cybelea sp.]|nr:hypothetical protein [Candidatus Cybelea sp.]
MIPIRGSLVVGLGSLALAFSLAGCGARSTALAPVNPSLGAGSLGQGVSPLALTLPDQPDGKSCKLSSNVRNFNKTAIKIGNYIWFASLFKVSGGTRNHLEMLVTDSKISFSTSKRSYTIKVPNMRLSLRGNNRVRLGFGYRPDSWELLAPPNEEGKVFLDGVPFQVDHYLPGSLKNITWTAKFYGSERKKISWQWGAAVYSQFSLRPSKLGVKPVRYRNGNKDFTGTPENFKQWLIAGATGKGGKEYRGKLGDTVDVTLCR